MTTTVISADGTRIAVDRVGEGPAVVLVGGAMSTRFSAGDLAAHLAPRFTVYSFDRRGRGDSGDTPPYAAAREIDDLAAVIAAAGGSARVYGHSSGAVLALEAAAAGLPITALAVYEPPYTAEPGTRSAAGAPEQTPEGTPQGDSISVRVRSALDAGDPGGAVRVFLGYTGMDDASIDGMSRAPWWPAMVGLATTLPYDLALVGDARVPVGRFGAIGAAPLVIDGGRSPAWAAAAADAVAAAIPEAKRLTIQGQDHGVDPVRLAPVLGDFFA